MKCPESIEELQELEKLIPLCKIELYEQAKARIETGAAKSVSEASRQIGEETGRSPESIGRAIIREQNNEGVTLSHLSERPNFIGEAPDENHNKASSSRRLHEYDVQQSRTRILSGVFPCSICWPVEGGWRDVSMVIRAI